MKCSLCLLVLSFTGACSVAGEVVQPLGVPFEHADLRDREEITFAVFGDIGTGEAGQYEVAAALRQVCEQESCDFVLVAGDNIYPDGIDGVDDPQLQEKFEQPYASLPVLDFWLVPGNHDRRGSVQAQIDYTAHSRRWRMPDVSYEVPALPEWLHVLAVDTTEVSAEQGPHVEAALCGKPGLRFAFGHHPMASNGEHGGEPEVQQQLGPVFERCEVQAYFAGHDHHQELLDAGATLQVVQGAGAKTRDVATTTDGTQRFAASERGFAIVQATADGFSMRFYDAWARLLYEGP